MTIRTFCTLAACLLAFPLLASCVKQGDIDVLNARMSQNEQRMNQLSSQVGSVEQVLPGQAEMWARMQSMRQELNLVRGQMDEVASGGGAAARSESAVLGARVTRLENALRQMAGQLGVQVEALDAPLDLPAAQAAPGAETPAPAPGTAPGTVPGAISTTSGSASGAVPPATAQPGTSVPAASTPAAPAGAVDTATALYDSGMNAFSSRNYRAAVKAFSDFTKSFPQHKLASNAHFWRGESYYQLKDYAGAALAYNEVIEKFPGSAKFQSAMLKQGMAMYFAGKKDAGKIRLNELIKKYPSSPEAGRAKKFLQENK